MRPETVAVIGSINMDLVVKASRFPRPFETMVGETFHTTYGGKGANQAVTVARLGAPTSFIGCVGDDAFGDQMVEHMAREGVNIRRLRKTNTCSSGTALIIVDAEGRNEIIVIRGANDRLQPEDIKRAQKTIGSAKVVVIQLEIPLETVLHAIETAHKHDVPVILNPAPAPAEPLHPDWLRKVSILVPNEVEAEALTGLNSAAPDFIKKSVRALQKQGPQKVIITLGDKGCAFGDEGKIFHVPAYRVRAEDTTGAGDAFVGALAAALGHFSNFADTIRFASAVAALSVTRLGAQSSLPTRVEIQAFLQEREPSLLKGFSSMAQRRPKKDYMTKIIESARHRRR